ncbi:hypothetical protein LPB41_06380 [Thalassospira sp. MA62]|nr:hypothetical protein [Thalassospira sp. MA62]
MAFAIALPDATPVFTDWLMECKRQVEEPSYDRGKRIGILVIVGVLRDAIEYIVAVMILLFGGHVDCQGPKPVQVCGKIIRVVVMFLSRMKKY